jgi:hypothetical protein
MVVLLKLHQFLSEKHSPETKHNLRFWTERSRHSCPLCWNGLVPMRSNARALTLIGFLPPAYVGRDSAQRRIIAWEGGPYRLPWQELLSCDQ